MFTTKYSKNRNNYAGPSTPVNKSKFKNGGMAAKTTADMVKKAKSGKGTLSFTPSKQKFAGGGFVGSFMDSFKKFKTKDPAAPKAGATAAVEDDDDED